MSEYTAEDFAHVMFAKHPDPDAVDARYAARMSRDPEFPWLLDGVLGSGDEHMARDGWVPVVEAAAQEKTIADLRHDLDYERFAKGVLLAELRQENRRLDAEAEGVVSLDALSAAWEAAEAPTDDNPIREGDTLIFRGQQGDFAVYEQAGVFLKRHIDGARILSRAPKREPWQDLADDLAEVLDADARYSEELARDLHNGGWRKCGDES